MGRRTVTVTGSGRVAVVPDVVRLDLRVGHEAADVAGALAGAASGVAEVVRVVRSHGVPDADLRTLDASVSQRWDAAGTPSGFTAQQRLAVTVRRPDAVGDLLADAAARVGDALLVDQVRLDVADRAPALVEARTTAFADARARAEQYARLAGARLGEVLGISEAGVAPVAGPRSKAVAMAMEATPGMPVEAGELEVAATVVVSWRLTGA